MLWRIFDVSNLITHWISSYPAMINSNKYNNISISSKNTHDCVDFNCLFLFTIQEPKCLKLNIRKLTKHMNVPFFYKSSYKFIYLSIDCCSINPCYENLNFYIWIIHFSTLFCNPRLNQLIIILLATSDFIKHIEASWFLHINTLSRFNNRLNAIGRGKNQIITFKYIAFFLSISLSYSQLLMIWYLLPANKHLKVQSILWFIPNQGQQYSKYFAYV